MFVAVMVSWVVLGLAAPTHEAQDALPLVVAGELVMSSPQDVYNTNGDSLYDLGRHFRARVCDLVGDPDRCDDIAVAFVSPPSSLPLLAVLARAGPGVAIRALTGGAALVLVAGMGVIWKRLALVHRRAPVYLLATAVLVTPLVLRPITLGQTSPLMFLSVALGVGALGSRTARMAIATVLVLVISFKAAPVLVLAVLAYQRRWRLLGSIVAGLVALSAVGIAMGGPGLVPDFVASTRAVESQSVTNPYNSSIGSALYRLPGLALSADTARAVAMMVRLVLIPALVLIARRLEGDALWAFAWVVLVALAPLSWWHYAVAPLAAVAVAVAVSRAPERVIAWRPVLAALSLPLSIASDASGSLVVPRCLWFLAAVILVPVIATRAGRSSATAVAPPSSA